jgi:ADP-ribose pyrophosphatase
MSLQRTLFKGHFLQVDAVDGKYEVVRRPAAVGAVIYWQTHNEFVFVEHYRPAIAKSIVEIVAGLVDEGEEPENALLREINEEVGLSTTSATKLGSFYATPGYSDEVIHLFFVTAEGDCLRLNDSTEALKPISLKIEDVWKLEQMDMKTSLALYLSRDKNLLKDTASG